MVRRQGKLPLIDQIGAAMSNYYLMPCVTCDELIAAQAKTCPKCGQQFPTVHIGQHTFIDAMQGFCGRLFPSYLSFHQKQPQLARAAFVAAVYAAALAGFAVVLLNILLVMYFAGMPIFQFMQDNFNALFSKTS